MKRIALPATLVLATLLLAWGFHAAAADRVQKGAENMGLGRYKEAERHYEKAAENQPGNPQALYGLAKARIQQGKYGEAQTVLNRLQQEHPGYAPTWFALGELYESQGNQAGAMNAYKTFLQKSNGRIPPDPEIMLKLRKLGLY